MIGKRQKSQNPLQKDFLAKLFAKPKKPFGERASVLRKKLRLQLAQKEESAKAIDNFLEINKVSMGSIERNIEQGESRAIKKRVETLKNRLSKINEVERAHFLKRIRNASSRKKFLVLSEKKFSTLESKRLMVDFAKSISLVELSSVCSRNVNQDWEVINSRKRDIINYEIKKSRHFSRSANYFLHDLYIISQELVLSGNQVQQKHGLNLFARVEKLSALIK